MEPCLRATSYLGTESVRFEESPPGCPAFFTPRPLPETPCVTKDMYEACGTFVPGTMVPQEWELHPYDCTDQTPDKAQCMFCKGRANDKVRSVCLPRLGAPCNIAFNSPAARAFCNLEFECAVPALSFSLVLLGLTTLCLLLQFF